MEPYLKARDLDKKMLEKAKLNANFFCQQLGQYRMPFAWTAINVLDILAGNQMTGTGSSSTTTVTSPDTRQPPKDKEGTPEPGRRRDTRTNSLSFQSSRSALEDSFSEQKEAKKGADIFNLSQDFRPVTLTVNVFFKQVCVCVCVCVCVWGGGCVCVCGRGGG